MFVENVSKIFISMSYKFHRIPDTQSRFITQVHDFTGTTLVFTGKMATRMEKSIHRQGYPLFGAPLLVNLSV